MDDKQFGVVVRAGLASANGSAQKAGEAMAAPDGGWGALAAAADSSPARLSLAPLSLGPFSLFSPTAPLAIATPTVHHLPLLVPSRPTTPQTATTTSPLFAAAATAAAAAAPASAAAPAPPSPSPLYKTELCRSFEREGSCRYGLKCQFAHGPEELRPRDRGPKWRTVACRTFSARGGVCPFGSRCRFRHDALDLQAEQQQQQQRQQRRQQEQQQMAMAMAALAPPAPPAPLPPPPSSSSSSSSPTKRLPFFESLALAAPEGGSFGPGAGGSVVIGGGGGGGGLTPATPPAPVVGTAAGEQGAAVGIEALAAALARALGGSGSAP